MSGLEWSPKRCGRLLLEQVNINLFGSSEKLTVLIEVGSGCVDEVA